MQKEKMIVYRCVNKDFNRGVKIMVIRESDGFVTQCLIVTSPKEMGEAEKILARRAVFGDLSDVRKGDSRLIDAFEKINSEAFFKQYLDGAKISPRDISDIDLSGTIKKIVTNNELSIDEEKVLRYKIQHDTDFLFTACEYYGLEVVKKELESAVA